MTSLVATISKLNITKKARKLTQIAPEYDRMAARIDQLVGELKDAEERSNTLAASTAQTQANAVQKAVLNEKQASQRAAQRYEARSWTRVCRRWSIIRPH